MSNRLQRALDREPVPRDLEAKVRARLDGKIASPWRRLLPSLSMLLALLALVAFNGVSETNRLLRLGIADHRQCAIAGAYPKQSDRKEMVAAMGSYSVMLQPILDQLPGSAVVSAHRCTIEGNAYMHVIVRRGGELISVMMTKRDKTEVFPRMFSAGFFARPGAVRNSEMDGYAVSGFRAGNYMAYVVSSMPENQNREVAERMAPVVRKYTGFKAGRRECPRSRRPKNATETEAACTITQFCEEGEPGLFCQTGR